MVLSAPDIPAFLLLLLHIFSFLQSGLPPSVPGHFPALLLKRMPAATWNRCLGRKNLQVFTYLFLFCHFLSLLHTFCLQSRQIDKETFTLTYTQCIFCFPYFPNYCSDLTITSLVRSLMTSPAMIRPTTEGTNAVLPGISRRSVHLWAAPGGQIQ